MGFGSGKDAIARWRKSEIEVLNQICLAHGIWIVKQKLYRNYLARCNFLKSTGER